MSTFVEGKKWEGPVPNGSTHEDKDGVVRATAEFSFLVNANRLPFLRAVQYGMELCGKYVTNDTNDDVSVDNYVYCPEKGARKKEIKKYLKAIKDTPEGKKALDVLKYVKDNSASPVATYLYMVACMPMEYGGLGLPKPDISACYLDDEGFVPRADCDILAYDLCWYDLGKAVVYVDWNEILDGVYIGGLETGEVTDVTILRDLNPLALFAIAELFGIEEGIEEKVNLAEFSKELRVPRYPRMTMTEESVRSHML